MNLARVHTGSHGKFFSEVLYSSSLRTLLLERGVGSGGLQRLLEDVGERPHLTAVARAGA
jgi:hypothetical protein